MYTYTHISLLHAFGKLSVEFLFCIFLFDVRGFTNFN